MRRYLFLVLFAALGCHNHKSYYTAADPGDLNRDGVINELDLDIMHEIVFGDENCPEVSDPFFYCFDLDFNFIIDIKDYTCLEDRVHWNNDCEDED